MQKYLSLRDLKSPHNEFKGACQSDGQVFVMFQSVNNHCCIVNHRYVIHIEPLPQQLTLPTLSLQFQGNLSFNSTGKITGQVHFHSLTKISVPRSMILRGIDSSLPSLVERTPNEAHLAGKNGVKMTWLQTSAMINDGRQCSFILEIHWRFIVGNWFLPLYIYCNVTWNSLVFYILYWRDREWFL